jgi:hypothetical protein
VRRLEEVRPRRAAPRRAAPRANAPRRCRLQDPDGYWIEILNPEVSKSFGS